MGRRHSQRALRKYYILLPITFLFCSFVYLVSVTPRVNDDRYSRMLNFHPRFLEDSLDYWKWSKLESSKGAYVAQQKNDYACMLLLEDVCYVLNPSELTQGSPSLGMWYARNPDRDLSTLDLTRNACQYNLKMKQHLTHSQAFTRNDLNDLSNIESNVGKFVSYETALLYFQGAQVKSYWDLLIWKIRTSMEDIPVFQFVSSTTLVPLRNAHMGHFVQILGGLAEVAFHLPFTETLGQRYEMFFVGSNQHVTWTETMVRIIFGQKVDFMLHSWSPRSVCFRDVLFPLNMPFSKGTSETFQSKVYTFAGVEANKTAGKMQIHVQTRKYLKRTNKTRNRTRHLGSGNSILRGQRENKSVVGRHVLSNLRGTQVKQNVKEISLRKGVRRAGMKKKALQNGGKHTLKKKKVLQKRRWAARKAVVPLTRQKGQITIVKRLSTRRIENFEELKGCVKQAFPEMPIQVVMLEKLNIKQQIRVLYRSTIYVTMHGASMSNIMFLRPGSVVIELFPYKFLYGGYRRLAALMELHYFSWYNKDLRRSKYENDCYKRGNFESLSEEECHLLTRCRTCVRDLSTTVVNVTEIRAVLLSANQLVQNTTKVV